jgi:D-glucosaminate-6-phosphate ammonia-lyase
VALKPGEYKIVADRLYEVLAEARPAKAPKTLESPTANISGVWEVEIQYEVGAARHKLFLTLNGNQVTGTHRGWAYEGDLKGQIDGGKVRLRSTLPADGNVLTYAFTGAMSGASMSGEVQIGEYGRAKWSATRHQTA